MKNVLKSLAYLEIASIYHLNWLKRKSFFDIKLFSIFFKSSLFVNSF